jgi:hypothetical protein
MQKKGTKIAMGMGLGMAIGGAAGAIGGSMMHAAGSPAKKKAAKALRSVEDVLGSLQSMLK